MLSSAAGIIFIITIGISLYTIYKNHALYNKLLLRPYYLLREKEYYTIITSGFLHGDFYHLLFNMLTFFFFAFSLERSLSIKFDSLGPLYFLVIYFGSMILADLPSIIKHKDNPNYASVGASGAISGILFSSILYRPDMTLYVYFFLPIPALVFAFLYLIYCQYAANKSQDNINHDAHFMGAIAGILLTLVLDNNALDNIIEYLGL